MITPRVCVAVLNYNGARWLHQCLRSVLQDEYPKQVVVVDNGSTDESVSLVRTEFPSVAVIALGRNIGFAKAYNLVFARIGSEFTILLNNDVVVEGGDWVRKSVDLMDRNPEIAAVAWKMVYMRSPRLINSVGGAAYWWTGAVDVGDGEVDEGRFESDGHEPFAFCGGAAMMRTTVVRELGGFDEAMFAYREDFDLSWRLRLRGFKIAYLGATRVHHAYSSTAGSLSYFKMYNSSKNWLRAMLKNYEGVSLVRAVPVFLFYELGLKSIGLLLLTRRPSLALVPMLAIGWNLLHLRDTLRARRRVQVMRRYRDRDIFARMGPGPCEPLRSMYARLMLSTDAGHLEGVSAR